MNKQNLEVYDLENLRVHYGLTLSRWIENFEMHWDKVVSDMGIEFARMWKLYLYISKAMFLYGFGKLHQITFSNGLNNELPLTRKYIND